MLLSRNSPGHRTPEAIRSNQRRRPGIQRPQRRTRNPRESSASCPISVPSAPGWSRRHLHPNRPSSSPRRTVLTTHRLSSWASLLSWRKEQIPTRNLAKACPASGGIIGEGSSIKRMATTWSSLPCPQFSIRTSVTMPWAGAVSGSELIYSASRVLITPDYNGHSSFNASELLGRPGRRAGGAEMIGGGANGGGGAAGGGSGGGGSGCGGG